MNATAQPSLGAPLVAELHRIEYWRHLLRATIFVGLYCVGISGALMISARVQAPWSWMVCVPFYLLAGASLHGISLFTHEAVHGTLARNPFLNRVLGAICAIPVLQNCSAYRVLHLNHHRHLGEEGDPDHYANYTRWTWLVFIMNWLRLIFGYPVYIVAIPLLGFRQGTTRDRIGILAEVFATLV